MRSSIIYIVDDDVSVCRALKLLLESHGFEVRTFTQGEDFLSFKRPKIPSCLVLDLKLPHMNGLQLQEKMASQGVSMPIIFISGRGDIPQSVKAMKAGAVDFLTKPVARKKLIAGVNLAIAKNKIQRKDQDELAGIKRRISTLSPREQEVFRLVARGMLSKQIAYHWGIALQTVKVHRSRVMQKMRAKTVAELIKLAQKAGIIR